MTNQRWVLFCVDQSEMSITCSGGSWTAIKIETDPGHDNYQTGGNVNLHLRVYQSGSSFENIRPGLDNIPLIVTPWCPCTVENSFPRWAPPALSSVCIQQHRTQPGKHQDSSQLNVHHSRSRLKKYLDIYSVIIWILNFFYFFQEKKKDFFITIGLTRCPFSNPYLQGWSQFVKMGCFSKNITYI